MGAGFQSSRAGQGSSGPGGEDTDRRKSRPFLCFSSPAGPPWRNACPAQHRPREGRDACQQTGALTAPAPPGSPSPPGPVPPVPRPVCPGPCAAPGGRPPPASRSPFPVASQGPLSRPSFPLPVAVLRSPLPHGSARRRRFPSTENCFPFPGTVGLCLDLSCTLNIFV